MPVTSSSRPSPFGPPLFVLLGLALAGLAWTLPANLKSVSPALLREAGEGTPSLAAFGRQLVESEKIGPAALVLAAARKVGDDGAPRLEQSLKDLAAHQPDMVAWGGWDPFLDPLFNLHENKGRTASTPVLDFFIAERARESLRSYLANSRSLGVQSVLRTRDIGSTGRFVPAKDPGGQPLDAIILLTSLLYQGEHLSPALQRQVRSLADQAVAQQSLGDLEPFYLDLLSLGRRLDWVQLTELLRRSDSVKTVGEYAHLARVAPDQLPAIYAAALFSDSADRVATYLIQYGKQGLADLELALRDGQGAVRELMERQVPVNRRLTSGVSTAAALVLLHPVVMLVLKYLGYVLGVFLLFRGLDRWVVGPGVGFRFGHLRSGALAVLFSALFIVATEPFLLHAAPPSEFRFRIFLPALVTGSTNPAQSTDQTITHMDSSTLLSIAIFASLQVAMYLTCLLKIRQISRSPVPPQLKLRLMENEENLFDGGLYVGIAGTATALVLQVLRIIEPNLLAAYSSNLFGIVCVALVKIRSVRPYKRQLILESHEAASAPVAPVPASSSAHDSGATVVL